MVQEYKSVCIVGAGASGTIAAYFLQKAGIETTLFDYGKPLRTILPTGGGRCNLAHAIYDFRELAKNYPRGEKFLYSIFSKFNTFDTINLFEEIGIKTYTQENNRIYPISNSSKDVQKAILNKLKNVQIINEQVIKIQNLSSGFKVTTNKSNYFYSDIIIATGGARTSRKIQGIEHTITQLAPSLVGLNANIKELSGIVLKNVFSKDYQLCDDILFTHFGISGPLVYTISSLKARESFPYILTFDLIKDLNDLQLILNLNPHKDIKNILSMYLPKNFVTYLLKKLSISINLKGAEINSKLRNQITNELHNFQIEVFSANKGEETVTCGGIDLKEINPKTLESKKYPHLYFIGEVLDIDGFCGGFNLQNAWSTAFVAANSIIQIA